MHSGLVRKCNGNTSRHYSITRQASSISSLLSEGRSTMSDSNAATARWIVILVVVVAVAVVVFLTIRKPQTAVDETAAPVADSTGRVAFRMEQQWLIKM